jgi:hypothetical protein
MGKIDLLLAALAEELLDLIATTGEGSWLRGNRGRGGGYRWYRCRRKWLTTLITKLDIWRVFITTFRTSQL